MFNVNWSAHGCFWFCLNWVQVDGVFIFDSQKIANRTMHTIEKEREWDRQKVCGMGKSKRKRNWERERKEEEKKKKISCKKNCKMVSVCKQVF